MKQVKERVAAKFILSVWFSCYKHFSYQKILLNIWLIHTYWSLNKAYQYINIKISCSLWCFVCLFSFFGFFFFFFYLQRNWHSFILLIYTTILKVAISPSSLTTQLHFYTEKTDAYRKKVACYVTQVINGRLGMQAWLWTPALYSFLPQKVKTLILV